MSRWPWLCMCLSALLHLNAATGLPMDADEPVYLRSAEHYADALVAGDLDAWSAQPHNPEHPALVKLMHGVALVPLGDSPSLVERLAAVRAVEAVGGVVFAGLLASVHPVAGLVGASHSLVIKYTSQGYLEAWPMVFMLLSLLCWRSLIGGASMRTAWLLGLALGATAACKLIHAAPGVLLLVHLAWRRPASLRIIVPVGVISAVALDPGLWSGPLDVWMARLNHHGSYAPDQAMHWLLPLDALGGLLAVRWHPDVLRLGLDPLFVLGGVVGLVLAVRRKGDDWAVAAMGLTWFFACLLFLICWPTRWAQHALILVIPMALGSGALWDHLWGASRASPRS